MGSIEEDVARAAVDKGDESGRELGAAQLRPRETVDQIGTQRTQGSTRLHGSRPDVPEEGAESGTHLFLLVAVLRIVHGGALAIQIGFLRVVVHGNDFAVLQSAESRERERPAVCISEVRAQEEIGSAHRGGREGGVDAHDIGAYAAAAAYAGTEAQVG